MNMYCVNARKGTSEVAACGDKSHRRRDNKSCLLYYAHRGRRLGAAAALLAGSGHGEVRARSVALLLLAPGGAGGRGEGGGADRAGREEGSEEEGHGRNVRRGE